MHIVAPIIFIITSSLYLCINEHNKLTWKKKVNGTWHKENYQLGEHACNSFQF